MYTNMAACVEDDLGGWDMGVLQRLQDLIAAYERRTFIEMLVHNEAMRVFGSDFFAEMPQPHARFVSVVMDRREDHSNSRSTSHAETILPKPILYKDKRAPIARVKEARQQRPKQRQKTSSQKRQFSGYSNK